MPREKYRWTTGLAFRRLQNHHVGSVQTVSAEGFTPLLLRFLLSCSLEVSGKTQTDITGDGSVAACSALTGHNRVS